MMRIDARHHPAAKPIRVYLDPADRPQAIGPTDTHQAKVQLTWDDALDPHSRLLRCPVCSCRELFVRRDFPQRLGIGIVIAGAVVAMILFSLDQVVTGLAVLGAVALVDALIYPFTKRCLVCYRCRSEFRGLPIPRDQPGWDLATGEKYAQRV